jgi:phosphoribosyl-dephospho-CoA transferase
LSVTDDAAIRGTCPDRHDLIVVSPKDWPTVWAACSARGLLSERQAALVEGWGAAARPVIVRRPALNEPQDALPTGLPLPPSLGKLRLSLSLQRDMSWRRREDVALAEAKAYAPAAWHDTIDAIAALGDGLVLRPSVFGALLWQKLTGLAYLHQGSDLDLLWRLHDDASLPRLLAGLADIDATGSPRVDGEVRTPAGWVNWRELWMARRLGTEAVLVKTRNAARFVSVSRLFTAEAMSCC